MKSQLLKLLLIAPLMLLLALSSDAAAITYDWAGNATSGSKTDWTNPRNWVVGTTVQTTAYPGFNGTSATTTDIVRIGVSTSVAVFTNFPVLAKSLTIASLTFGNNNAPVGNDGGIINFTVNNNGATATVLTVNGTIQQNHSTTGGLAGTGGTTEDNFEDFTYGIQTTLSGTGSIICKAFVVGDNGICTNNNVVNVTAFRISNVATSSLSVTVNGTFTLNSASSSSGGFVTRSSRALVSIGGGTLTVNGTIKMTNFNPGPIKWAQYEALVGMSLDLNNGSSNSPVLNIGGVPAFNISSADNTANSIDFYNPLGGTGTCTANYTAAGNQIVNTGWADNTDIDPYVYDNLGFSGSGTKTVDVNAFTVLGNFTLGTGTETVDLTTNNPAVTINGNYSSAAGTTLKYGNTNNLTIGGTTTNNGTFNQSSSGNVTFTGAYTSGASSTLAQTGTGTLTFSAGCTNAGTQSQGTGTIGSVSIAGSLINSGTITQTTGDYTITGSVTNSGTLNLGSANFSVAGDYTNSGTYKQTTGTTIFNSSGTQKLNTSGTTAFHNVTFNGTSSNKILQGGKFTVGDVYVLTLGGSNTKLTVGGGSLTLLSDANGSATVASIPSTCQVNGNVSVQRFITGGTGARGYRLLSSPVYTNLDAANNNNKVYSINYLADSTYLSGTSFTTSATTKSGNPSIYLFRENLVPAFTSFLNSNFRGVASLSGSPNYTISPDGVNSDPGTYTIPVGNGYLYYYRGAISSLSPTFTAATAYTAGSTPDNGIITITGTLNQGNVTVIPWSTPGTTTLLSTTVSGLPGTEGFNLVGNPYAAALDMNNYSTSNSSAGIYGPGLTQFIYELKPGSAAGAGNYGIWSSGSGSINGGSSTIASGQGFFVQAAAPTDATHTATLTFTEAGKKNTSPGATSYLAKLPASAKVIRQYIRLQLALDTVNSDETLINFNSGTSAGYNIYEDARYKVGTGRVNLASFTSDRVMTAINSMPLVGKGQTIPLKMNAAASGTYTFSANEISGIPAQYDIWLKDNFTKDSIDLRKNPSYSLTINLADTNTYLSKRLSIMISQNPTMVYKLISFEANRVDNKAQIELKWATANELNNTEFTIQRSTDNGKTFEDVDSLISNGSGSYSYIDKGVHKGDNLYRLKQVDYNNNINLSNMVDVQFSDKAISNINVSVYPNPAVNHITLNIDPKSRETTTYEIKITNSFGLIVKQVVTTQVSWEDNISNLFTGTYLIQVLDDKNDSLIGQTKFVKL